MLLRSRIRGLPATVWVDGLTSARHLRPPRRQRAAAAPRRAPGDADGRPRQGLPDRRRRVLRTGLSGLDARSRHQRLRADAARTRRRVRHRLLARRLRVPGEASDAQQALRIADQRMYADKHGRRPSAGQESKELLLRTLAERDASLGAHVRDVADNAEAVARALALAAD